MALLSHRFHSSSLYRLLKWLSSPLLTLLGTMLCLFILFHCVAGDPSYILAGKGASPADIARIRTQLGLSLPWYQQLFHFLYRLSTFQFGESWITQEPVNALLFSRLPPSLMLLIPLMLLETTLALGLALVVARVHGSLMDKWISLICTAAMSVSLLVYILLGQYWLAFRLEWFPVQGWQPHSIWGNWHFAALPILLGIVVSLAPNLRLYRSMLVDAMSHDYVRTARANGLNEWQVMHHVLRNAWIPISTYLIQQLPGLLTGAFLLERFFSIPGMGREVLLAVDRSDLPILEAITFYVALATIICTSLSDMVYRFADPRIRLDSN
jgi:peptide/nickel transport system permease protein